MPIVVNHTWVPKIVSALGTLSFTLQQRLWSPSSKGVGGQDVSAAGVPESFLIRRDQLMTVTLVFYEAEWPDVQTFVEWAMSSGQSFQYWFDVNDAATQYTCYLDAPIITDKLAPVRSQSYSGAFDLELTLRTTNGTKFNVPFIS